MISRNYGLDVLRACAILLVLVSHALFFVIQTFPNIRVVTQISYFCGFWGVELFFVLSGFLIGGIIRGLVRKSSRFWIVDFWIKRWFRTLPCYFLFLFLNSLWFYSLYSGWPGSLLKYLFFIQNLAWRHPVFFPEAWSLAIEEFFYFLFPLLILFSMRRGINWAASYLISGVFFLLFSTGIRLFFTWIDPGLNWHEDIRKVTIFRFDALMYGIFLSFFINFVGQPRQQKYLFFLGILNLVISGLIFFNIDLDHDYVFKALHFSITSLGFMLIVPYMRNFRLFESSFWGRFLKKTALWSYSIYLSNLLINSIIQEFIYSRFFSDWPRITTVISIILFFLICYKISAICYKFYEIPIMNLREVAAKKLINSLYRIRYPEKLAP